MMGWGHFEGLDFVWRIILKRILKKQDARFWIGLSGNVMGTITTLRATYKAENFWVTEIRISSQEEIRFVSKLFQLQLFVLQEQLVIWKLPENGARE